MTTKNPTLNVLIVRRDGLYASWQTHAGRDGAIREAIEKVDYETCPRRGFMPERVFLGSNEADMPLEDITDAVLGFPEERS